LCWIGIERFILIKKIEKKAKMALARLIALFLDKRRISPGDLAKMKIERLLIIRQHNQMGDMLLAVPAFRGIRGRFPGARISIVAAPINTDVMLNNPFIDEVLTYAKKDNNRIPFRLIRFILSLRKRRFDAVIVLNTVSFSITSMLLAAVSGAGVRIGSTSSPFGHDLSSVFYNLELPLPSEAELETMHESSHNLYPLSAIGVREEDLTSLLVPSHGDEIAAESLIGAAFHDDPRFIVVHPGAGKKQNVWPPERFAALSRLLYDEYSLRTVLVRGPVDLEAADLFLKYAGDIPLVLACPSVGLLGSLMKRTVLTLCNDTGIMHIAGAVGGRCIAVFGPTDPQRWKPRGEGVVAVRAEDKNIESVGIEDVVDRARSILLDLSVNQVDL